MQVSTTLTMYWMPMFIFIFDLYLCLWCRHQLLRLRQWAGANHLWFHDRDVTKPISLAKRFPKSVLLYPSWIPTDTDSCFGLPQPCCHNKSCAHRLHGICATVYSVSSQKVYVYTYKCICVSPESLKPSFGMNVCDLPDVATLVIWSWSGSLAG